jgi:hypothetical protein
VDYGDAITKVKEQIKAVKAQALRRKEIVVRMEILQQSLCDRGSLHNLKGKFIFSDFKKSLSIFIILLLFPLNRFY